jgi:Domain of unknown function (DUF6378)
MMKNNGGAEMLAAARDTIEARRVYYGSPEPNFRRIAARWSAHLGGRLVGGHLTPADIAIMMIDVKLSRLAEFPSHADSWLDVAGYSACGFEVTNLDGAENA